MHPLSEYGGDGLMVGLRCLFHHNDSIILSAKIFKQEKGYGKSNMDEENSKQEHFEKLIRKA